MANPFDQFDNTSPSSNPFDQFDPTPPKKGGFIEGVKQVGSEIAEGARGLVQAGRAVVMASQLGQAENLGKAATETGGGFLGDRSAEMFRHGAGRAREVAGGQAAAIAASEAGSTFKARPVIESISRAKSAGEAWDAFTTDPLGAIVGVTAQSAPLMVPALLAGAFGGPAVGAAAMGASSGAAELGGGLIEFAGEQGVDVKDSKALNAFFSDPANLRNGLSYAGTRAGIIGATDAATMGLASKTLAPKVVTGALARQAINVPTQMAAQAAGGAGGEALAQVATKGEITQPGQVLLEAVGELGGAPAEVAALARRPAAARPSVQAEIEAVLDPNASIDDAIAAADQLATANRALDAATEDYLTDTVPPVEASARPTAADIDRQAALTAEAATAGTEFERQNAAAQAQTARGEPEPGAAAGYADLTPMNPLQARQRLAVLRDQVAQEGGNALGLEIVPHPSQQGALAIRQQALPSLEIATPAAPPVAQTQQQIESAALAGADAARRAAPEETGRQELISRAMRAIEERGGVASPAEAKVLREANMGQPYDRVDPALAPPLDEAERLTQATGIAVGRAPREEVQTTEKKERAASELQGVVPAQQDAAARASERSMSAFEAGAPARAQARAVGEKALQEAGTAPRSTALNAPLIQAAISKPAFARSTEERAALQEAQRVLSTEDYAALATPLASRTQEQRLAVKRVFGTERASPVRASLERQGLTEVSPDALSSRARPGRGGQEVTREMHGLMTRLGRVYGKKVVVYEGDDQRDGFFDEKDADTIYVNRSTSKPHLVVFGHELLHSLKQSSPETYDRLAGAIRGQLKEGAAEKFAEDYGQGADAEELVADIVGNRMTDEAFWLEVFDGMSVPAAQRLGAAIVNAVNKAKKIIGKAAGFATDDLVKDLDAVKSAVTSAMREFAKVQRGAAQRMSTEEQAPVNADQAAGRASAGGRAEYSQFAKRENSDEQPREPDGKFASWDEAEELDAAQRQLRASRRRAFHGTHARGIDKFTTEKMGTGEGNQSYGWGLYFAGRSEIAEFYRKAISAARKPEAYEEYETAHNRLSTLLSYVDFYLGMGPNRAQEAIDEFVKNRDAYSARLNAYQKRIAPEYVDRYETALKELNKLGQLYEVDIPGDDEVLDYGARVHEQPEQVRLSLDELGYPEEVFFVSGREAPFNTIEEARAYVREKNIQWPPNRRKNPRYGSSVYQDLAYRLGSDKAASLALREAGIPGLRYKDAGSRGPQAKDVEYNYVIFSGGDVKIEGTRYSRKRADGDTKYQARAKELAAQEKPPARSTVNFFTRAVPAPKLPTNFDIARYFTRKNGRYMDAWPSPQSRKALVDVLRSETLYALSKDGSAVGWYDRKVKAAYATLAELHPEIETNKESRFAFTALLAITSNSTAVNENFEHAEALYRQWKEAGEWPTKVAMPNKAGKAMEAHLAALGRIVKEHGWKKTEKFLTTEHPVREIEKFTGMPVPSELASARVHGALAFGSKVGTFFNNLHGNYDSVTMDRWFMRTINRNRGNMLSLPEAFTRNLTAYAESLPDGKAKDEALAYVAAGGAQTPEAALKALPTLREAAKKQYNTYIRGQEVDGKQRSFYPRTRENVLSKLVVESLELDQQTPMGGADRAELRAVMRDLQSGLRDSGIDIEIADLQAVLWYYEKDLFDLLKGKTSTQENLFNLTEGLDGAEDYETAARTLLAKRRADAGQPRAERAGPGRSGQRSAAAVDTTGDLFGGVRASPRRDEAPLPGAPKVAGATGPDPRLTAVAERYARSAGIPYSRQSEYVEIDEDRARRIADAYAAMKHDPQDPKVKEAYEDLIKQTRAQYDAMTAAGYSFWFMDPESDPYKGNPWNAMRDLRENQVMAVFPTSAGFGSDEKFDPSTNPLLADTGLRWPYGSPDGETHPVLANDLFRAVHDAFGHGLEGAGFRARGEENAWQAHAKLFTGPALGALTSETRGQNSWLNYGPHGEKNRTAKVEDTVFADQKTGLMPEWTWTEGRDQGAGAILNIGLADPAGGENLTRDRVEEAVEQSGADIIRMSEHVSDTEPTLVLEIKEPLSEAAAESLSAELGQESIAQRLPDGSGELYGPSAPQWRPFNPDFFLMPDGSRASGVRSSPSRWTVDEPGKMDNFLRAMQDKQIDTKRVVEAVRQQIGDIGEEWNPYLKEELYHGRTAKRTQDFLDFELRPLLREMLARGVSMEEFETYLHNRHAQERNEQIAKVNDDMPDGGSGIDTADAQAYLAGLSAKQRAAFEALAKRVDAINASTERMLVTSGLEKQSTIDAWNSAYKSYVPLNRTEFEEDGQGSGQGMSVRGNASRRAMGSDKAVGNILANIAAQRERTIVRAEKNRVATALYGMAIKAPSKDFWKAFAPERMTNDAKIVSELVGLGMAPPDAQAVMEEPTQRYVDPRSGRVVSRVNPLLRSDDNVLALRVNGEDRFVMFSKNDERANKMVRSLKNLDADKLGRVLSISAKISRYFASINTQWNPIFGVINILRDTQGALLNLSTTPIADRKAEVLKNAGSALVGIYADIRAHRKGRMPQSPWAQLWEEFQKEGGQTGFRDMYANPKERSEAIKAEIEKITEGSAKAAGRAVFDWLSDYNTTLENAVRLSAYKAGVDKGLSKQQAASIAKNLTVNFNRKGEVALQAGALYAFFNASAQGTARLAETLRGPAGKKIVAGGLLLGVLQALAISAAGFDEEEPPEFIRDRNLVLPIGEGKFVSVPMPLGLHVLPAVGRRVAEWMLAGGRGTGERLVGLAGLFADAFNPIGNAGISMQTVTPTALDWAAALMENKDFAGREIAKEDRSGLDPTPGFSRAKDAATGYGRAIAWFLNRISGGTEYQPGAFSPTPDQIDYFLGQIGGGLAREAGKVSTTAQALSTGEELPTHKVPLLGRFYGDTTGQASAAAKFYSNLKRLNGYANEVEGLRKDGDGAAALEFIKNNPEARLAKFAQRIDNDIREAKRLKSKLVERGAPPDKVRAVEARITALMQRLNSRVDSLREAGESASD